MNGIEIDRGIIEKAGRDSAMGERALQNRIIKLQELEAQQKAIEQEADKLKEEIKKEMEARGKKELETGNFIIRWKTIMGNRYISGNCPGL